jgi:two-component system phosphate regulon sensor histidine kinase PhoR
MFALISRSVGAQVRDLSLGATRFAAGDLRHRIREPAASELASLARALNDMARQMDARLREIAAQQQETDAILQSMSNGVMALDSEQRIIALNRAAERILGVNAAKARGRLLHEVVRQPELHRLVNAAMSGGEQNPVEFALTGAGGAMVEARTERLKREGGGVRGLLVVFDDVTRLRRLESLRSDFAANVSHELRTPITNIKGYVETLLETGLADREQAERFLTVIRHNSDRLAAIVEDVLALTRLERASAGAAHRDQEAGGARPSPEEFPKERAPIRGILASAIAQHQAAADAKSIAIELAADADLTARVHSALLEQAVSNLISNAINYSPPRTQVRVSAGRLASGEIEIAVKDEGPGIAKEHQERIFERFYRIDRGRSREVGGTGLGLAIVKHIVREHRGTVSLESEVGKGSTFRIVIPIEATGSRE